MPFAPRLRRAFSDDQVREMRTRYRAGERISDIARAFKCHTNMIRAAVSGVTYKDVDGVEPVRLGRRSHPPVTLPVLREVPADADEPEAPSLRADLLWGVERISEEIGLRADLTAAMLRRGDLPAHRVGKYWVTTRQTLREALVPPETHCARRAHRR